MYEVIEKEILNPTVTKMVVEVPAVAKKAPAGQFIILRVHENGERILLTIMDYDRGKGTVTIIFQIIGRTTMLLNQLNIGGSILDFVGPFGKPSHVDGYKKVRVIGGGVGCAIAYPTAKALHENGTEVIATTGFRNKGLVILEGEFKQVSAHAYLVSDDDSTGIKGLVTSVLEDLIDKGKNFDEVTAIGPLIMMEFVCQLTKRHGIKTMVSMNPIVIDDVRMCGGCRLNVGEETKFACMSGPNLGGHLVDFDEAVSRGATYRNSEVHARNAACNLTNKEVH